VPPVQAELDCRLDGVELLIVDDLGHRPLRVAGRREKHSQLERRMIPFPCNRRRRSGSAARVQRTLECEDQQDGYVVFVQ
jgi:hypothetical protein